MLKVAIGASVQDPSDFALALYGIKKLFLRPDSFPEKPTVESICIAITSCVTSTSYIKQYTF